MWNANILMIEDDADIREGVRILLESENYRVTEAKDGQSGLKMLSEETDLVILDIMMPGMSGLKTCEEIRKVSNAPVLFLTAKARESDKLIGLLAGGDDYLTKPFSYAELLGRVKALLRRYQVYCGKGNGGPVKNVEWIEYSGLRINQSYNEVYAGGKEILYESIWDEPYFYSCGGTVMVHIGKLLVIAFCISAVFFTLIHAGGEALTRIYLKRTHYTQKENERRIGELEAFVRKNRITPDQSAMLTKWVDRQRVVWLQIYRDNTLLYDSKYSDIEQDTEYYIKNDYSEWEPSRQVEFQDGMADVFLYGMYTYQFLNIALVVELLLSFLLFLGIVMAGIHRSMSYIKRLSSEIEILEDGNLDYPVTVLGKDELAVLANGIDNMRRSVKTRIRQEKELMKINQAMITGLSHDLRTPLTSLMI